MLWKKYFDKEYPLTLDQGKFNIYEKGDSNLVILCLHGAGYSGLSFALFATEVSNLIECQVVALDLRGHGKTSTIDDNDLSLKTLAQDVTEIANIIAENKNIVVIGHSLGGAVAVESASSIKNLCCLCVIDIVEGSALSALPSMRGFLKQRPSYFKSISHAMHWYVKNGMTRNIEAAEISILSQIINMETKKLASDEYDEQTYKAENKSFTKLTSLHSLTRIDEDHHASEEPTKPSSGLEIDKYKWRTDLTKTEEYWADWFHNLSNKFLDIPLPKILLLPNIHSLDTILTVGQMQGKFQLKVLPKSGHAVHEDQPDHVATIVSEYLTIQKLAINKMT